MVALMPRTPELSYRPMSVDDIAQVPLPHQGDEQEVLERIATVGSSALLAFDGARHVGQLQFRRYQPGTRSSNGVWDPLWWMDFADHAPDVDPLALAVCCCHVGQLDDTADRDATYLGRGIGAALLDHFLDWARENGFPAVIAKSTPAIRPVMEFLGGFPSSVYRARGFEVVESWVDLDLERVVGERALANDADRGRAMVSCCVLNR